MKMLETKRKLFRNAVKIYRRVVGGRRLGKGSKKQKEENGLPFIHQGYSH